jgi:very-short-patch-repair endonuclease
VGPISVLDGGVVKGADGDRAVAAVATRQHGVVSRGQLIAAGIGRRGIERRLDSGRLHRIHSGVYAVGHTAGAPLAREAAALLACGDGAALSHRSAAACWGLVDRAPAIVEVTVVGPDPGARPGVRVRRARRLAAEDLLTRSGLPTTAPARTLLDLAAVLGMRGLRRAVNEAFVAGLADEDALHAVLVRCRGRRGGPQLRRLLAEIAGPTITRSEAERRLLELLGSSGLPDPATNVIVANYEVDLLWRAERLVVEVDGYAFHGTRAAFERDRLRDAELQADGYAVLRITWRQIVDAPQLTVTRIARVLGTRSARLVESATA